jgi:hypothetical protein
LKIHARVGRANRAGDQLPVLGSSVLSSKRAVQMNIVIIRAFVKLREILASNRELARRLDEVEDSLKRHGSVIGAVVEEIKKLKRSPATTKRRIGFMIDGK